MKMHIVAVSVALMLFVCVAAISFADIPAPPVNQNLGLPDGIFNNLLTSDCRVCHNGGTPPEGVPIEEPYYVPSRHHALVDQEIPEGSDSRHLPGMLYECFSCHSLLLIQEGTREPRLLLDRSGRAWSTRERSWRESCPAGSRC